MPRPKEIIIGDMRYWMDGEVLGKCDECRHNDGFSYNEDGNYLCVECLEEFHGEEAEWIAE